MILGLETENILADMNSDGSINIQDIILIINIILADDLSRNMTIDKAEIKIYENKFSISANNALAGLELHTSGDYLITKKIMPEGWDFFQNNNTIIMVDLAGNKNHMPIEIEFEGNFQIGMVMGSQQL